MKNLTSEELTNESTASEVAAAFEVKEADTLAELLERTKTEWLDPYHTDEVRYLLHALAEALPNKVTVASTSEA